MSALAAAAVCAVGLTLALAGAGRAPARPQAARSGILIPSSPREILPLQGGTVHSTNWSGYAVASKSRRITAVSGSFVVPKVRAGSPGTFAATWAGIGGYFRRFRDLIQAGTGEDSSSGGLFGKQYFAWYELLPAGEVNLRNCHGDRHCRVKPGNRISVTIRRMSSKSWMISMRNSGHWRWSKRVHYSSSRSSAEWILEAPTLVTQTMLAPVGTVHFGPTSKYTVGIPHTIAQGRRPIRIILSGEAKPSPLANGQSFNDCAYRSRACPRP